MAHTTISHVLLYATNQEKPYQGGRERLSSFFSAASVVKSFSQESPMCYRTPGRMKMRLPTDEKGQLMIDPLEPFIRWKMIFQGIAHVQTHATKDENHLLWRRSRVSWAIFAGVVHDARGVAQRR